MKFYVMAVFTDQEKVIETHREVIQIDPLSEKHMMILVDRAINIMYGSRLAKYHAEITLTPVPQVTDWLCLN